ncbi:MAG: type I methionyl aminopeptidase [Rickettsiales bacterium]|jgi:methionyl aminopeptidase|nr:type I methionyl aminopeptidase [Rickettsiales bacterium]
MLPSVYAPKDWKRIRAAGDIVARALDYAAELVRPGISTAEIDAGIAAFLKENGAKSSCLGYKGYPKSICASVNDTIVHGIPRADEILKEGDIVNIDLTAEYKGFHADSSRMFSVGRVSDKARKISEASRDCMNAAIGICAPGVPLSEIGRVIEELAKARGFSVSRDFVGHGIGKVMHDNPQILHFYDKRQESVLMVPGLVFTIEPMLCEHSAACKIDSDGWTARTKDGGLSAQWEHTIGITESGPFIFTERAAHD